MTKDSLCVPMLSILEEIVGDIGLENLMQVLLLVLCNLGGLFLEQIMLKLICLALMGQHSFKVTKMELLYSYSVSFILFFIAMHYLAHKTMLAI